MRVFAEAYYELLQPAQAPNPDLRQRLRLAALEAGHELPQTGPLKTRKRPSAPTPTLDDQMIVFEGMFEGMSSPAWTELTRARGEGRQLKRHRDHAITEAAVVLARPALQAWKDRRSP